MNLISINFLLYIAILLIIYYLLPQRFRFIPIALFNIVFILYDNLKFNSLFILITIFLISYFGGLLINTNKERSRFLFILSVLLIVIELVYFKYTGFLITTSNYLFGTSFVYIPKSSVIGLSYFSLIMIRYLTDIYWGTLKPEKNPAKLFTFMTFFPVLTSGPFIKYDINEQIETSRYSGNNIYRGLIRVLFGIFKVLVVSNRINCFVNTVYDNTSSYNGLVIAMAVLLYTFELYTNFSGSIDIVIGISKMFNIDLPENFNNPFSSQTITELWRRWHMTLGGWLKNYIFYPLQKSSFIRWISKNISKNKKKGREISSYVSLLIMWFLIGAWHGGEYKFVISAGLLQFFYLMIDILFKRTNTNNKGIKKILCILRTYLLFSISMVFFRAESVSKAIVILKSVSNSVKYFDLTAILSVFDYIILLIGIVAILAVDNNLDCIREKLKDNSAVKYLMIIFGLIIIVLLLGRYGIGFNAEEFIYGKF